MDRDESYWYYAELLVLPKNWFEEVEESGNRREVF